MSISRDGIGIEEEYEVFAEKLQSSRLAELFFALCFVSPSNQIRNIIFDYAVEMDKERWEELTTSKEAAVLTAVISTYQRLQTDRLLIKDIAETLNQDIPTSEWYSNRKVSGICKELGFSKTLVHGFTAIHYNQKLIERLQNDPRYAHCFNPSPPPQNISPISPENSRLERSFP